MNTCHIISKLKLCSDSLSDDKQGESTLTLCISVAHANVVNWMTSQNKPADVKYSGL